MARLGRINTAIAQAMPAGGLKIRSTSEHQETQHPRRGTDMPLIADDWWMNTGVNAMNAAARMAAMLIAVPAGPSR